MFRMQSSFVLCLRGFAFLIVDLTFHGQRHLVRVRRQPLCSGGFACLGSHHSLANCTTVEVVVAGSRNCLPKLWQSFDQFVAQISTSKAGAQRLQPFCRCISSNAMKRVGQTSKVSSHDAAVYWGGSRF